MGHEWGWVAWGLVALGGRAPGASPALCSHSSHSSLRGDGTAKMKSARARTAKRLLFWRETNPRETRDARTATLARTWSLSAKAKRSSRSVSFPNRSALVCRRTRRRLGNGQASPGSGFSPACVGSDKLTRLCLSVDSGSRLGVTNAGIVRSKRTTRHEMNGEARCERCDGRAPRLGRGLARVTLSRHDCDVR